MPSSLKIKGIIKVKELSELSANSEGIRYPLDIQDFAEGDTGEDTEVEVNGEDKIKGGTTMKKHLRILACYIQWKNLRK